MKKQPSLVALLMVCCGVATPLGAQPAAVEDKPPLALEDNMCVMCHGTADLWDADTQHLHVRVEDLAHDVHWQKGIQCQDCHGGNAQSTQLRQAHATEDGFRKIEKPSDEPDFCAHCHANAEYMTPRDPDARLTVVSAFLGSVHGKHLRDVGDERSATCSSCHPRHTIRVATDPESSVNPAQLINTCGHCHQRPRENLLASEHKAAGEENADGVELPLSCSACHSEDAHATRPIGDMNSPVFVNNQIQECGRCHEQAMASYQASVHGYGLEHSGLISTATCASCHGAHDILKADNPQSALHPTRVAKTCATCHRFIEERLLQSVHGRGKGPGAASERTAPGGTVRRKPSCTDCHVGHDLPHPRSAAFRYRQVDQCGNCHVELNAAYNMSMHGALTELGYTEAAKCADCHGAHEIRSIADPASRVTGQNRLATCANCHPSANLNFASFNPHANHRDARQSSVLHYTFVFMETLLYSVFGFFGVHTLLWFGRSWVHRARHGIPPRLIPGGVAYVRFASIHRTMHLLIIVSFLGLALTGLPLKYSSLPWAQRLAAALGGFESTSVWHRIFAIVTFSYFFSHLFWLTRKIWECRVARMSWKQIVIGPDSPIPNVRDFQDLLAMIRWFVGVGPKPTFDRWSYWEKFDYWAVFWGVAIIGVSGLMLWFPALFCTVLPGTVLNIAKVIHSEEALLATGFIFTIHFFNTHLRAEKFPMDMGMLTGLVTEEELADERPEFLARMREAQQLEQLQTNVPSRRAPWLTMVAGYVALTVGIALLIGMVAALFR